MAKDIKKRFTVSLDIDTKDAEKQIKATVGNLKTILSDLGTASDKMIYFKELTDYLSQIDAAMDAFKKKHGQGLFDKMFGGLDTNLRKELENVFGVATEQLTALDQLKTKVASAKASGATTSADLKPIEQEVRSLYEAAGMLDKLDLSGRSKVETRIQKLEDALEGFAVAFDGVNNKISKGFGFGEQDFANVGKPIVDSVNNLAREVETKFDNLKKIIQKKVSEVFDAQVDGADIHKIDKIKESLYDALSLTPNDDAFYSIEDIFDELAETGDEDKAVKAITSIAEKIKSAKQDLNELLNDTEGAGKSSMSHNFNDVKDGITQATQASGKFVDKLEYIKIMAAQIKRLFDTMSDKEVSVEYKILMNGHELNLKAGSAKEVDRQTSVESLLGALNTGATVNAHSHPSGTSSKYNHLDINEAINSFYSGSSKLSAIVGADGVTTLDLAKVKMEDALDVYEKLKKLKTQSVSTDKLNKLFAEINPEYGDVAKHWDPSEFEKLSAYIYNIENSAEAAIAPLERFKNIVTMAFGNKQVSWDKYNQLLEGFDVKNATSIFNQIAQAENMKIRVSDTTTFSLDEVIAQINRQKQAFVELRQEADITYADIQRQVQEYLSEVKSGGTGNKALEYFKKYFGANDFLNITDYFAQMDDGILSANNVTNAIAGYFPKIDPEEYIIDSSVVNSIQDAKTALKEFLDLTNTIKGNDFYSYDAQGNVEIGKYIERLTAAKKVLDDLGDQGLLTAEQLSEVTLAFDQSKAKLEGSMVYYDGYGSGYSDYVDTYEDEYYQAQAENERLRAENEKLLQDKQNKTSEHLNQLKELEEGYDPDYTYYDTESLENILQERNALIQSLKSEGAITDELLAKHEALNAEIQREIDISHAYNNAEVILNKMDDMYDTVDMDDMDEVSRMLESRKQMLDSISSLAFEDESYGDSLAEQVEQEKEQNALLEQRISLLGQVRQGLISIDDVDDILKESGSLNDKLERLGDFIYTNDLGDKIDKDDDDDITNRLEAFEAVYDRIILKLANGRNIEILPDMKGLNALVKLEKSDDGTYGPTDIEDVIFVRKQEQAVLQQNSQELQEQLNLQKQINDEVVDHDGTTDINGTAQIQSEADAHNANADAIKVEATAIEQRNEALKEGNALKAQEDTIDHSGVVDTGLTTGTSAGKEDIAAEIQQLERLKAILLEVEQAVQAKTQAFRDEGLAVEQTVSREIEALRELVLALSYIKSAIDTINDSFTSRSVRHALPADSDADSENVLVPTEVQNSYALETTLQTTNGYLKSILEALSGNKAIDGLVEPLKNVVTELKNVASGIVEHQKAQQTDKSVASARIANNYGQLSSITGNTLSGMGDNIQIENMKALADNIVRVRGAVQDIDGVWKGFVVDINESNNAIINAIDEQSAFAKSLNETAEAAKEAEKAADNDAGKKTADRIEKLAAQKTKERELQKTLGQVNLEKSTLGFNFNARGLNAEQTEIAGLYDALIAEVDKYEIAVKEGYQAELDGINASKNALFEKIDAYKTANNIIDAGKTGNKKAPGATVVKNATTKYNALKNAANTEELQGSMVAQQKLAQYAAAYEKLINLQKQYKVGQVLSPDQEQEFNDARVACNNYAKEVEKLLKLHQKARDEGDQSKRYEFEGDFQDTDVGRQQVFKEFLDQYDSSSVTFEKFDDNFNKMIYTVNNGDGTLTKMTATINSTRTAIDVFAGEVKEAKGVLGEFFDQFKGKLKSVGAYMMATVSIHDAIRVVKQGVQYVKEIDLALTELKKVTNETEQSYTNFLNTASQTASKIGSTVADFTNATADFARLGYNMDQAAELAKAASVYKNVGDGINDIATASESIISTMKAFGIEADSAMGIVDRFNEVGKYIAQAA